MKNGFLKQSFALQQPMCNTYKPVILLAEYIVEMLFIHFNYAFIYLIV